MGAKDLPAIVHSKGAYKLKFLREKHQHPEREKPIVGVDIWTITVAGLKTKEVHYDFHTSPKVPLIALDKDVSDHLDVYQKNAQ
jgi:hypothetical protein